MNSQFNRLIHLLYVPTMACNLGCRYCYLGNQTAGSVRSNGDTAETLSFALNAFLKAGVLPYNVSLHGGEPTILPPKQLDRLFNIISRHYLDHFDELNSRGYRKSTPHIKTNLFNFHKLYDLFVQHRVSISASIDLPLALHGKYRTTRTGKNWLPRTLENLRLLAKYPHSRKVSATLYGEHLADIDAIIADIRFLHDEIGFDMNNFNIMFGFESGLNRTALGSRMEIELKPAVETQQIALYNALKDQFSGSMLEEGFRRSWFEEFTPAYCTNAVNCGEKFMLLQGDGSVWSCVRGQGLEECSFGNILSDPVEDVLAAAKWKMAALHQQTGFSGDCRECSHLQHCHTGCPVVKLQQGSSKSYTCGLQKVIYKDNPACWPEAFSREEQKAVRRNYLARTHPALAVDEAAALPQREGLILTSELNAPANSLKELVAADPVLSELYSESCMFVQVNGERFPLRSQILSSGRVLHSFSHEDEIVLYIRRSIFDAHCDDTTRNTLHLQMLRDIRVIYGDEKREKQEHLFTHELFYRMLEPVSMDGEAFFKVAVTPLLRLHAGLFINGVLNNLFVTTGRLRAYHYQKQQANAFYHIQAINLPFQNLEFYWDE